MSAPHLVTRGIVLRETFTKETDKILTLLTEDHGKIAVIARGVRGRRNTYAACAQMLAWSEWTLYQRKEWYFASDGATLELFPGLRTDLCAMALGCYFAELTEAVSLEETPSGPLLRHLLNGLYVLSALQKPPELVRTAFEWKLLSLAGFEPALKTCSVCGRADPSEPMFSAAEGVIFCRGCGGGQGASVVPLCRDSLEAARHIVYGDAKRLYAFRLGAAALRRLGTASEHFLFAQMERRFRTLEFYKSTKVYQEKA